MERLLGVASALRVLATSQVPLAMDGETVHPLEPLAIADSIALFTQRAVHQRRSLRLDGDTGPLIEQVCRSLDGHADRPTPTCARGQSGTRPPRTAAGTAYAAATRPSTSPRPGSSGPTSTPPCRPPGTLLSPDDRTDTLHLLKPVSEADDNPGGAL